MHVHYRPSNEVLERVEHVNFVAVVGPSAVGKTTLIEAAVQRDPALRMVLFTTSRRPRSGERDGVDYHFRNREQIEARIEKSEYVNVAPNLFGDLYVSAPEDYTTAGFAVTAVLADTVQTFRSLPFASFRTIFVVPPSWDVWQKRIMAHGFTDEQRKKRLDEAKRSLLFGLHDEQTQFVINNELLQATEDFIGVVRGNPFNERLKADQQHARGIIRELLDKIEHQT